jgi:hypothetical protein
MASGDIIVLEEQSDGSFKEKSVSLASLAQVNSDWSSTAGVTEILNKPALAAVATSGDYTDLTNLPSLATVATSGDYNDLVNTPSVPPSQVNSDWVATTGLAEILNKPTLAAVATSGDYTDLANTPTIPAAQVNSDWTATTGSAEILNKPTLATVATSGDYADLTNTPSIAAGLSPVANAGINIDVPTSSIKTTYNTLIGDGVTSIAVGGASALPASAWKTKNIVEVLDTILFPDVLPTYTVPAISLNGTQSGEKEVGTTISQALTLSGSKNDAGAFTALSLTRGSTSIASTSSPTASSISNIADQFGYANPNSPNQKYDLAFTDSSVVVVSGANTWAASGTYAAGLAKKNNKGVTDARAAATRSTSAPQLGATFSPSSITVTGIYPYFYGVSAGSPTLASIAALISGGTSTKVLANASGSLSINYTANSQFIWFAHSDAYTTKTKWSEQGSLFNTGAIGNSSSTGFMKYLGTVSVTSPDSVWTTTFKIYCSGNATIVNSVVYVFANS